MNPRAATRKASLSRRLSGALALQAFVILGTVCTLVYAATSMALRDRQDDTLNEKKAMVRHILSKSVLSPDPAALRHTLRDFLTGHEEMSLLLRFKGQDDIVFGPQADANPAYLKRLDFNVDALLAQGETTGAASLFLDTTSDAEMLGRLAWILAISALGGALTASVGGLLMVRRAMAPVHDLVQQIRRLRADRLDLRIDGTLQPQELQPVVTQFNELLEQLERAYSQLEAFSANVAHELNTPLAVLMGSCQLGLQRTRSVDELREILSNNLEDLDRMAGIVRDMLFLAKADQGARVHSGTTHSLRQIAMEVMDFHEAPLLEAGLQAEIDGDASVTLDAGLIRRALSNLVGNAIRYADRGSKIRVGVQENSPGEVAVFVENQGLPIPEVELTRIFERFHRVDRSRTGSDVNNGLGLAIVRAIAHMHRGTVFAQSHLGVTRVGMRLPTMASALSSTSA